MGANIDDLVEELREPCRALLDAASAAGLQPRITSTLRSFAEQKRLYRRFLAGQQGFPVLPPGSSAHEYGEAFDMVVTPMDALDDVGYTWQTWGGAWSPKDAVHFEIPGASARAVEQAKYILQTTVGTAMGQSASDLFMPPTSYIPGVTSTIELAVSQPGKRASAAADLYLWLANLGR
jgi:hypothetical protein